MSLGAIQTARFTLRFLRSSTALVAAAMTPVGLGGVTFAGAMIAEAGHAQAGGGSGGSAFFGVGGGAGGTGVDGANGNTGGTDSIFSEGGGGGGGAAGSGANPGGSGGQGGFGGGAGGAGGTSVAPDGLAGSTGGGDSGAGGGGGGYSATSAATIANTGTLTGGNGGTGGTGGGRGGGGGGGAGGAGAVVTGSGTSTNSGTITGGNGGNGGGADGGIGGSGGGGGEGVIFTAGGATFDNSGTVTGGNGGAGAYAFFGSGVNGAGGAGVVGGDLTVVNSGSIAGGSGGNAITFTGGANSLAMGTGGTLTGNVAVNGGGSLVLDQTGNDATIANAITGDGSVEIKAGTHTLTLTGANSYSGGTTVTSGTVSLAGTGGLGSGTVTNAGTVVFTGSGTFANAITISGGATGTSAAASGQSVTTTGDVTLGAGATIAFGNAGNTGTIVIQNAAVIDPSAMFAVNGGTVDATAIGDFGTAFASVTVGTGATLQLANGNVEFNSLLGGGTVENGGGGPSTVTLTGGTFGGAFTDGAGSTALVISGGTVTLTGDNSGMTGGITVAGGGTLSLGSSLAGGGGTITTTGSVIDYADGIDSATPIVLNSDTTQLQVTTGSATQSGVISETGASRPLEKIGAGTLVLSGVNSYTGLTTVSGGTLEVASGGVIAGAVLNDATLVVDAGGAAGAVTNTATGSNAGTIAALSNTGGAFTNTGTISGPATVTAGTLTSDTVGASVLSGGLSVNGSGAATVAGGVNGTITTAGSGGVTVNGATTGVTAITNEGSGGLLVDGGGAVFSVTVSGMVVNATTATVASGATLVAGGVQNQAGALLTVAAGGSVTDDLENLGTVNNDGVYTANVLNRASGVITNGATNTTAIWNGDVTSNGGQITNNGTWNGDLQSNVGQATNTGTWNGSVLSNLDTFTTTGTVTGDVTSRGTVNASGSIEGNVVNRGVFTVTGALSGLGGSLETYSALNVTGGDYTGLGAITNAGTTTVGAGLTLGGSSVSNSGTLALGNGSTVVGAVSGTGSIVLAAGASATVDGGLTGGTVDMGDGAPNQSLAITNGTTGGPLIVKLDANTDTSSADTLSMTGGSGTVNMVYNLTATTATAPDLPVITGTNLDQLTYNATGLSSGAIVVSQQVTPTQVSLVTQLNPGVGGTVSGLSVVQSLIGTVINRPSSIFASTPVYETKHFCAPGAWARVVGGRANASANSTANTTSGSYTHPAEVDARYQGIQAGGDWGCYNSEGGWDVVYGANVGFNHGTTGQNVYGVDPTDPSKLTSTITSVTSSKFDQAYGGLYLVATKANMSFNLQVRREHTSFDYTNPDFFNTGSSTSVNGTTITGDFAFAKPIGKGLSLVPRAGFGLTRVGDSSLAFSSPVSGATGTMTTAAHTNKVVYVAASLQKTRENKAGDALSGTFVTGSIYHDFSADVKSSFVTSTGTSTFTTSNLGTFGEVSVGFDYLKVLNPGQIGAAKQFNASVRADARFSGDVHAFGVTAQMRLQF